MTDVKLNCYCYIKILESTELCAKIKLFVLHNNTWNQLTVCKQMSSGSFRNVIFRICVHRLYIYYQFKDDLALNSIQGLICYKT